MVKCCGKYNARQLREAVTFERKTRTSDGAGGFTDAWAAISGAPDRAMVKPMSGSERYASQRVEATATHRIVTRFVDDGTGNHIVREDDRATIRGRDYNIRYIANVDFGDQWVEMTAQVGVAV